MTPDEIRAGFTRLAWASPLLILGGMAVAAYVGVSVGTTALIALATVAAVWILAGAFAVWGNKTRDGLTIVSAILRALAP